MGSGAVEGFEAAQTADEWVIDTVAGSGFPIFSGDGIPATEARLTYPPGVAVDNAGNLYIADFGNRRVRKVGVDGIIDTIAGTGARDFSGDGGPATAAELHEPHSVAVDSAGNLYIADTLNHRIRRVGLDGYISTVAGTGRGGFRGDGGPATSAQLFLPQDVAMDTAGNLYIADTDNHCIRRVSVDGIIDTIAGTETAGSSGDGGPATDARLFHPRGVAVDVAGNLYVADTLNHLIRRLTPAPERGTSISSGGVVLATGSPIVNSISPNAIVSVFGREFLPEGTRAASPAFDGAGRVAANLARVCLEVDGKRAPVFAVFSGQINAQAPHDLTPGQAQVKAIGGWALRTSNAVRR